jgi:hypothetical protein
VRGTLGRHATSRHACVRAPNIDQESKYASLTMWGTHINQKYYPMDGDIYTILTVYFFNFFIND